MRFIDQIWISLANLWRRKLRTFLTVLGVIIGTVAIVVMMSIGIAQQEYMESTIGQSRELQEITIYSMGGYDPSGSAPQGIKILDQAAVDELSQLEHVEYVAPALSVSVELKSGPYTAWADITGIPRVYIDDLDWDFSDGNFPEVSEYQDGTLPLAIGREINYRFHNEKSQNWYMDSPDQGEPDVNMYEEPVFATFMTNYYEKPGNPSEDSGTLPPPPKKYLLQADGIIDSGPMGWSQFDWQMYTDINCLKDFLNMVYKGKAWPGQPATKTGRSTGKIVYGELTVKSSSIDHTIELAEQIRDLGYQANTSAQYIQDMKESAARTQSILGGIGAISLLVATIGIANTMMMSIYERTKEIGIYKVLGCNLGTIRNLFLIESGMIGFIGGVIGVGLSYAISFAMNNYVAKGGEQAGMLGMYNMGEKLSTIPAWLALSAMIFSVVIGMLAGLMPALRAMRLSPLEAIRTE